MANWYQDQLTNKNFLSPIGFLFLLDRAKKTTFLCQKANIPAFTTGNIEIPTRGFVTIPVESTASYEDLTIEFIVDEDLRNYMEIHNWMRALSTPVNTRIDIIGIKKIVLEELGMIHDSLMLHCKY